MTLRADQTPLWTVDPPHDATTVHTTSFTGNLALPVHRWFRYSAGFSAEWCRQEIRKQGARRVLDPFAGSGTTLLAAQAEGAESVGIDIHPFVSRVARAKILWTANADQFEQRASEALARARSPRAVVQGEVPDLVAKCFPEGTLIELRAIRDAIETVTSHDAVDELLWLAFVSILRRCSPVGTAQWQYVLPQKRKARVAAPVAAFAEQVNAMAADMRELQARHPTPPAATHYEDDIRTTAAVPDGWADMVLTSPPYANNFDYADATRLEMTFMGEVSSWGDLKSLRAQLIRSCSQQMARYDAGPVLHEAPELEPIRGELQAVYSDLDAVRLIRGGRKAYHSMVVAYFLDMAHAWQRIRGMTAPGGSVCFVVGDSAPYGIHVPVERWLGELALASGFRAWTFEKVRDRNTKWENRKHRVPLHEGRLWVEA